MIVPETILVRTATGSALLQTADTDLSRTERLLLIMVNGQVCVGDISNKLYSIPLRRLIEALDYLIGRGLISQDKAQITTPTALKRHELEAFLRTDELDPTTAMIANFELQAALNDSAHASVIVNQQNKPTRDNLDQRIQAKTQTLQTRPAPNEVTLATEPLKVVAPTQNQSANSKQTIPTNNRSLKRRALVQKKQSIKPFLFLFIFAVVWVAVIWYVRHR